jgi:hypothetical protein
MPEACTSKKLPKYKKDNYAFHRDDSSKKDDNTSETLSKTAVNQIVQAMHASANKPPNRRNQPALIQNGEGG